MVQRARLALEGTKEGQAEARLYIGETRGGGQRASSSFPEARQFSRA